MAELSAQVLSLFGEIVTDHTFERVDNIADAISEALQIEEEELRKALSETGDYTDVSLWLMDFDVSGDTVTATVSIDVERADGDYESGTFEIVYKVYFGINEANGNIIVSLEPQWMKYG